MSAAIGVASLAGIIAGNALSIFEGVAREAGGAGVQVRANLASSNTLIGFPIDLEQT